MPSRHDRKFYFNGPAIVYIQNRTKKRHEYTIVFNRLELRKYGYRMRKGSWFDIIHPATPEPSTMFVREVIERNKRDKREIVYHCVGRLQFKEDKRRL